MVTLAGDSLGKVKNLPVPESVGKTTGHFLTRAHDTLWYLVRKTSAPLIAAGLGLLAVLVFVVGTLLSPAIGPNVSAMGVSLSGLTVADAEVALLDAWTNDTRFSVTLGDEVIDTVTPRQIGLSLDARAMAEEAKSAGLTGFPFGVTIAPMVEANYGTAQQYMLDLADDVYIPPYEAGYAWENGQVVAVAGRESRELDIAASAETVAQTAPLILRTGEIELVTQSTPPSIVDPSPYLAQAQAVVSEGLRLVGYDPFTNRYEPWSSTPETLASWLQAGPTGLELRETTFNTFLNALNARLGSEDAPRYINEYDVIDAVNDALLQGRSEAVIRVRYLPTDYEIVVGDTGHRIGRKHGLPFTLINNVNPGVTWEALTAGQVINLPSRDEVLPEDVVPNKRIVVDLDRLWLVAYENGERVFDWGVASGRPSAPTVPGTFQILNKDPKATGSAVSLCTTGAGCAEWVMDWFMGIYEVAPGSMNGFHGHVLLPNGSLWTGEIGARETFGCVMSVDNEQARMLYEWSEIGTIVEIFSSEYPPQSDLGQDAQRLITQRLNTVRYVPVPVSFDLLYAVGGALS